jgi:transposase InsO family protein
VHGAGQQPPNERGDGQRFGSGALFQGLGQRLRHPQRESGLFAGLRGSLAGAIFHSDHGAQHTSKGLAALLTRLEAANPVTLASAA